VGESREVVEYVDGPLGGTSEERSSLPETIPAADGRYVRSVRCAEDGAMRYVWQVPGPAERSQKTGMKER
jgi:hypothetical protein